MGSNFFLGEAFAGIPEDLSTDPVSESESIIFEALFAFLSGDCDMAGGECKLTAIISFEHTVTDMKAHEDLNVCILTKTVSCALHESTLDSPTSNNVQTHADCLNGFE